MSFDQILEQYHSACNDFAKGNPEPVKRLYSQGANATLANPFGPAVHGWKDVSAALDFASSRFRDGEVISFESVGRYESADQSTIFEVEQWTVKFGGQTEMSSFALRATSTFVREGDTWKLVHRHADPIATSDPSGPLRGSTRQRLP
ncbi:MAG: nuclear transport factor 2 family protein [Gemmatimonadaceae bacterium]